MLIAGKFTIVHEYTTNNNRVTVVGVYHGAKAAKLTHDNIKHIIGFYSRDKKCVKYEVLKSYEGENILNAKYFMCFVEITYEV